MNRREKIQEDYKLELNCNRFNLDEDAFVDGAMSYIRAHKQVGLKRNVWLPMASGLTAAALLIAIVIIKPETADNAQEKKMVNLRVVQLPRSAHQSSTDVLRAANLGRTQVTQFLMTQYHSDNSFKFDMLKHSQSRLKKHTQNQFN